MGEISIRQFDAETDRYPPLCILCGKAPPTADRTVSLSYAPTWMYMMFLAFIIPGLILVMVFQKTAEVKLHMCRPCSVRNKDGGVVGCLVFLLTLGCFVAAIAFLCMLNGPNASTYGWLGLFSFLASVGIPTFYFVAVASQYSVKPTYMDDLTVRLKLPNDTYPAVYEEFIKQFPDPPAGGRWNAPLPHGLGAPLPHGLGTPLPQGLGTPAPPSTLPATPPSGVPAPPAAVPGMCGACGAKLPDGARFCRACGKPVA